MSKTSSHKSSSINNNLFSLAPDASVKISLWQLISMPLKLTFNNWRKLIYLGIPYALLLTICSLIFKRSVLCLQEEILLTSSFCSSSLYSFFGDMITAYALLILFSIQWYRIAIQNQPINTKTLFSISSNNLKTIAIIIGFTLINVSPIPALFILMLRTPNPNWIIELTFFTSIAWVFLLPILSLRFYSIIAFSLAENPIPPFKQIWHNTSGNMLKFILGSATIIFLGLFLFLQYYSSIQDITTINLWNIFIAEFEDNIITTIFVTVFINYCQTQKELLFAGDNNE